MSNETLTCHTTNEKRLIDANAVVEKLTNFTPNGWGKDVPYIRSQWAMAVKVKDNFLQAIADAPTVDAVEVVHARWEWFEEWNPSTPDHPRECDDCGWRCGRCKGALADMVGGYWDNYYEEPKLNYCPNCGAKMDGDGNG